MIYRSDNRAVLGVPGANPVPGDTRIGIEIESPEAEDEVRAMVSRAIAADPWFLAFRDTQPVSAAVSISGRAVA